MRLTAPSRRPFLAAACVALAAFVSGCASKNPLIDDPRTAAAPSAAAGGTGGVTETGSTGRFLGILTPYRVEVQQGNFVSREMVAQLKEGMTRDQVRFVLGTPLLTDIFHADRWDYVFRLQRGNGSVISSRVVVFFEGDRLTRIEGGDLPTEAEYLALIAEGK